MLRFTKLPRKALDTVRSTLEADAEFRARVAGSATESTLDRPSWLFLTRPDGWRDELDLLAAAAAEERAGEQQGRDELRAERRVGQLEETVGRQRDELASLQGALALAEAAAAEERRGRESSDATRAALESRLADLEEERSRAVRSLKDTEATAVARLEELRAARSELVDALARIDELEAEASAVSPEPVVADPFVPQPVRPEPVVDRVDRQRTEAVASAVQRAGAAAQDLAAALADAAGALRQGDEATAPAVAPVPPGSTAQPDRTAQSDRTAQARPPRRTPVRLGRGVLDDSVDGLRQLLDVERIVVFVDGYNVSMAGWPSLDATAQRDSLVGALGAATARHAAEVHVVFDGDAEGGRPAVGAPLPVRVHFSSAGVEADDLILSLVAGLPTDVPVAVVSSDRRVADGARRLGANSVSSEQLLGLMRR